MNKIKQPYLIQRGMFFKNELRKGIDSILRFDYMGAAEFEWGALPESLKRIREGQYIFTELIVNDKLVGVYCKQNQIADLQEYLDGLAARKFRLHEYSAFDDYIFTGRFNNRFDFWWDIENDIMFWRENEEFTNKFMKLIKEQNHA